MLLLKRYAPSQEVCSFSEVVCSFSGVVCSFQKYVASELTMNAPSQEILLMQRYHARVMFRQRYAIMFSSRQRAFPSAAAIPRKPCPSSTLIMPRSLAPGCLISRCTLSDAKSIRMPSMLVATHAHHINKQIYTYTYIYIYSCGRSDISKGTLMTPPRGSSLMSLPSLLLCGFGAEAASQGDQPSLVVGS